MNTALFSAIGFFAIVSAEPASAQPLVRLPDRTLSTTINYADLDLRDRRDARLMFARIRNAAAHVCRATPGGEGTGVGAIRVYDDCFRESVRRAVTELDAPRVTAVFESRVARRNLARLP